MFSTMSDISNKNNRPSLPPYKDPISAGILSFLALILFFISIVSIVIPFIVTAEIKNQLKNTVFYSMGNQIIDASFIPFILFAIGCFVLATILFVISNIASDAHLVEYNIRKLLLDTQNTQEEQTRIFQHIDDCISKQSDIIYKTNKEASPTDVTHI